MRNFTFLIAFLLGSFGLLLAQPPNSSAKAKDQSYRGCLKGAPGAFRLTSDSGGTYELVGDSKQLAKLSGDEVMVKGSEGSASAIDTGAPGNSGLATSNPTAGTAPTIRVNSVIKTADQCSK